MRLSQVAPYAAFVLLGQAALDSVPGVVAEREGGMGLGSALIAAQLTQVAGIALGAVLAAYVIERWSLHVAAVIGALAVYAGLVGVGHQPMHSLVWVIVVHGVGGAGLGAVLTASFSAAAAVNAGLRPFAVALFLLASLLARDLVAAFYVPGAVMLSVAGAVLVGGAAWMAYRRDAEPVSPARRGALGADDPSLTGRTALVGGAVMGIGVLATLWGADPSGVSGTLLARFLGVTALDALAGVRTGIAIVGLVALGAGAVLLLGRRRPRPEVALAATGAALAAIAAAGTLAAVRFGASPGGPLGGAGPASLGGAVTLAGAVGGILIGAWVAMRGASRRIIATAGSALLGVGAILALGAAPVVSEAIGPAVAVAAIALAALGGGLATSALRLVLAEVRPRDRAFAAAAGVVGGSFGLMAGLLVGAGEGMRAVGTPAPGISGGAMVLVGSAAAAVGVAALLPTRRAEPSLP